MWTIGTYWSLRNNGTKARNCKMGGAIKYNWKGVKKFRDFSEQVEEQINQELASNVSNIQDDSDTSFSSPTS